MSNEQTERTYQNFNPVNGYPAGSNLFYECLKCGEVVPSRPKDSTHCQCRNIMIDTDYGRIKIQEHAKVKLFSISPQP
jgi:hypothetical protein